VRKERAASALPPALPGLDLPAALEELREEDVARRLWARDPSLWKSDPAVQNAIRNRLGWLDLPSTMGARLDELRALVREFRKSGFRDAVLLGMGGSSLCPEVLRQVFGTAPGFLRLTVLDTTDPGALRAASRGLNLRRTLFVVSSKSGGTIEVASLFSHFWARIEKGMRAGAGRRFIAITDPGTALETLARERGFRAVFRAPPDVGGRYSALTFFGLLPAALLGLDLDKFLERADRMARASGPDVPPPANPAVWLGAVFGAAVEAGRDKLTLLTSPELRAFGLWAEQLVAESTGKEGTGLVPAESEPFDPSEVDGRDRLFIHLGLRGAKGASALEKALRRLEAAGHPVVRLELADRYDLAAEFFRWEAATAVSGQLLGINPFDEPNVAESKANTTRILAQYEAARTLPEEPPALSAGGLKLWRAGVSSAAVEIPQALEEFFQAARPGDYVALMAYVTPTKANHEALQRFRRILGEIAGRATTLGYGPRFLHSTGQLHKGGAANGLFLQFTSEDGEDADIPGAAYGFSILKRAQALGDFQALREHGRRVLRLHLSKNVARDLASLSAKLKFPAVAGT